METNTVLYYASTLKDANFDSEDPLDMLTNSGFTSLVLGPLHVNLNGDILWNDQELVVHNQGRAVFDPHQLFSRLRERLENLVLKNSFHHLFWGIGSGGFRDFSNIANLLKTNEGEEKLRTGFEVLCKFLPQVKGFDLDNEDHHDIDTVVWLTEFLSTSLEAKITYRPYFGQFFWEACLEAVYTRLQRQPVLWWNLQCYEDGKVNDPKDWAHSIALRQQYNGVEDPNRYIIPGYSLADTAEVTPAMLQQVFSNVRDSVGGGFLAEIPGNLFSVTEDKTYAIISEYSQAIREGILAVAEDVGSHDYD